MKGRPAIILASLFAAGLMLMAVAVSAEDKPSLPLMLRSQVWTTSDQYLAVQSGVFLLYDPIENRVLLLESRIPHSEVVLKGDFFVRCVDFTDQDGRKIDVDLLLLPTEKGMEVTQAVVHKINGIERQINLLKSAGTM